MARRRRKRKITARNRRFGAASRTCMAQNSTWGAFGTCMRRELKGGKGRRRKRR